MWREEKKTRHAGGQSCTVQAGASERSSPLTLTGLSFYYDLRYAQAEGAGERCRQWRTKRGDVLHLAHAHLVSPTQSQIQKILHTLPRTRLLSTCRLEGSSDCGVLRSLIMSTDRGPIADPSGTMGETAGALQPFLTLPGPTNGRMSRWATPSVRVLEQCWRVRMLDESSTTTGAFACVCAGLPNGARCWTEMLVRPGQ